MRKLVIALCVLASAYSLLAVVRINKILDAERTQAKQDQEAYVVAARIAATVGFSSGCMVSVDHFKQFESGDPIRQMFNEWCVENAKAFSKTVDFK